MSAAGPGRSRSVSDAHASRLLGIGRNEARRLYEHPALDGHGLPDGFSCDVYDDMDAARDRLQAASPRTGDHGQLRLG